MTEKKIESEWSHYIRENEITESTLELDISPNDDEKRHVARRLNIQAIRKLDVHYSISQSSNGLVHIKGKISGDIMQMCVVTLDPVQEIVKGEFEAWYGYGDRVVSIDKAKRKKMETRIGAELPILDEKDDPEPIINGRIDLGELATQHFSLMIDPYPHKEGVEFEHQHDNVTKAIPEIRKNPFEALRKWKKSEEKE